MKITTISLQGFRAFDEPFELDLNGGKNLLLHGENGSGKSSIFLALKRFFELQGEDIAKHRNYFCATSRSSYVRVHIKGTDSAGNAHDRQFHWDVADGHPLPVPKDPDTAPIPAELRAILVDGARRAGFLDYRMMLRTHLLSGPLSRANSGPEVHDVVYGSDLPGLAEQLFDLVSLVVLNGVRVTVSGGIERTLGELMRLVWANRPADRTKKNLGNANDHANAFNSAFNAKLPELEAELGKFLDYFPTHQLSVKFLPISLSWDKESLSLKGAELVPRVTFRGRAVQDHELFLNEARLSAIAICLFLAGVRLSDNNYANPAYPRFLVLDDALIGLDLQNRLPILSILTSEEFKNYQIFLLTHDRVWFDLARGHLPEKNGWLHLELLADEDTGHLVPRPKSSQSDLEIARKHLASGDLKAAAVYTRSAFEWKLRNVCENRGIRVPFKSDPDKVNVGTLWEEILLRQREREEKKKLDPKLPDFVPPAMKSSVEVMRSTVLNKLSHAGASGLVKAEVATAISTVEGVCKHAFPKAEK